MILIAGYELVNAKDRDGYVAASVASSRVPASSMGAFTSPSPPTRWILNGSIPSRCGEMPKR